MVTFDSIQKQTINSIHINELRLHTIALIVVDQLGFYNQQLIEQINLMFRLGEFDNNVVVLI